MVAKEDQTAAKSNLELAGKELKSSIDALGEVQQSSVISHQPSVISHQSSTRWARCASDATPVVQQWRESGVTAA